MSSVSLEVIPKWSQRAGSPTVSATCVRNAITSWRTSRSISATRAASMRARARSAAAASAGITPRSASSSETASSTSSQRRKRPSSVQIACICGRA